MLRTMFSKGEPILLFNGASDGMDAWDPSFLTGLSSNHTVIAFDQRGIGNTTAGSTPEFIKLQSDILNKSLNNISLTTEEIKSLVTASLGPGWIKLHPESLEGFENITSLQQFKPGLPP